jgi:hypothetical protein
MAGYPSKDPRSEAERLRSEVEELRPRLEEAEQALEAIRTGQVAFSRWRAQTIPTAYWSRR